MSNYSHPTILPILAEMKIQRMAVNLAVLFGNRQAIYLRHQSFAHITHLDVFDTIGEERRASICANHGAAHPHPLVLEWSGTVEYNPNILTDCLKLELLLVTLFGASWILVGYDWASQSPIRDTRFAVGIIGHYLHEWENGASGLPDFWSVADDFVAQKCSGDIDVARCWMGP